MGCRNLDIKERYTIIGSPHQAHTPTTKIYGTINSFRLLISSIIHNILKLISYICEFRIHAYDQSPSLAFPTTTTYAYNTQPKLRTTVKNTHTYSYDALVRHNCHKNHKPTCVHIKRIHPPSTQHLAYYNYRYYSPELGRWLTRDPINQKGSTAWLHFNRVNNIKEEIRNINNLLELVKLIQEAYPVFSGKYLLSLNKLKNFLEFELLLESTGVNLTTNPYAFIWNSPIITWDYLGLDATDRLARSAARGAMKAKGAATNEYASQVKKSNEYDVDLSRLNIKKQYKKAYKALTSKKLQRKNCSNSCPTSKDNDDSDTPFAKFVFTVGDFTFGNWGRAVSFIKDAVIAVVTWDRNALQKK